MPTEESKEESKDISALKKFTLNMGNFKTLEGVKDFIKRFSLQKAQFYRFGEEGKSIKLLYGEYDDVKAAKEDMANIDKKALSFGAYIDNMKKHDNLKIKYKDFN